MSVEALTWVFAQDIPSRAKTVLLAMANHADPITGHCYLKISTLMQKSSCSRRSTFSFIGLLRHNGFIDQRQVIKDDGTKASDYWLLYDRVASKWISQPGKENPDEIEEYSPDEVIEDDHEGISASSAPPLDPVENAPPERAVAPPQTDSRTPIYDPSDSNRSPELIEGPAFKAQAPQEFSSKAKAAELARLKAAEEARKPKRVPVIEGCEAWKAHVRNGHPPTLTTNIEFNGKRYRGWYFPSYFPLPKSTGPPDSDLMSPEDREELAKKWG